MKQYKVYLCDIKWSYIKSSYDKVIKGGIRSDIIFCDSVEYKDISKISEEQYWYLVNKNLKQELNQYKNNWEKLKKYIVKEWYCFDNESLEFEIAKSILNKMKELEENK